MNRIIFKIIFIIVFLSCFQLNAKDNQVNKCQIKYIENLFNDEFQLTDTSAQMKEFGSAIYNAMPYSERMYVSEDSQLIGLLGTFQKGVNFSMFSRDQLIEQTRKEMKKGELTKAGVIDILEGDPLTTVVISELRQNNDTLINIRTIIAASNSCMIGMNFIIPTQNWPTTLKKSLNKKIKSFQQRILEFFGKRDSVLNNKFVQHLINFDKTQSQLDINSSLNYLSDEISIEIKGCDNSVSKYDYEKYKDLYSIISKNAESLILERNITQLENCSSETKCTIRSNLSEKLVAFKGSYNKTTVSSETTKIEIIDNSMQIKTIDAEILCD